MYIKTCVHPYREVYFTVCEGWQSVTDFITSNKGYVFFPSRLVSTTLELMELWREQYNIYAPAIFSAQGVWIGSYFRVQQTSVSVQSSFYSCFCVSQLWGGGKLGCEGVGNWIIQHWAASSQIWPIGEPIKIEKYTKTLQTRCSRSCFTNTFVIKSIILLFRIFKTPSHPNHKSFGGEILTQI